MHKKNLKLFVIKNYNYLQKKVNLFKHFRSARYKIGIEI